MIYIATPYEQDANDELDRCITALEDFLDARKIEFYSDRRFHAMYNNERLPCWMMRFEWKFMIEHATMIIAVHPYRSIDIAMQIAFYHGTTQDTSKITVAEFDHLKMHNEETFPTALSQYRYITILMLRRFAIGGKCRTYRDAGQHLRFRTLRS